MDRLLELTKSLEEINNEIVSRESIKNRIEIEINTLKEEIKSKLDLISDLEKVEILLDQTTKYLRESTKIHIEDIVSQALSAIFEKEYIFEIEMVEKNSKIHLLYYLTSDGIRTQLLPPDYDRGGGVADIISMSLRLALFKMENIDGPLFLDEVGKHVSKEYSHNVVEFLRQYSKEYNKQIILITHNDVMSESGDKTFKVSYRNSKSVVE